MPKVTNTRKQVAAELLRRVTNGPSFSDTFGIDGPFSPAMAEAQYRRWAASWVLEPLSRLVPELQEKKR